MQTEKESLVWDLRLGTTVCVKSLAKDHGYSHAMGRIMRHEVLRLSGYPEDSKAEGVPVYRIELFNPPRVGVHYGKSWAMPRFVTLPRGAIEPTATTLFIEKMRRRRRAARIIARGGG